MFFEPLVESSLCFTNVFHIIKSTSSLSLLQEVCDDDEGARHEGLLAVLCGA